MPRSPAPAPAARPGPVRRRIVAAAAAAFYHPPLLFFLFFFFFSPLLELRARGGGDGAIPGRARAGGGGGQARGNARAVCLWWRLGAHTHRLGELYKGPPRAGTQARLERQATRTRGSDRRGTGFEDCKVGRRGAGRMGRGAAPLRAPEGARTHAHVGAGQGGGGMGHVLQEAGQGEGRRSVWSLLWLVPSSQFAQQNRCLDLVIRHFIRLG